MDRINGLRVAHRFSEPREFAAEVSLRTSRPAPVRLGNGQTIRTNAWPGDPVRRPR